MKARGTRRWLFVVGALTGVGLVLLLLLLPRTAAPKPSTPEEPLVPTRVSGRAASPTPWPAVTITPVPRPPDLARRLCAGVAIGRIDQYPYTLLNMGWYLDWQARVAPPPTPGLSYVRIVRVNKGQLREPPAQLTSMARQHRGSLWFIGNEPDVRWQDNSTPEEYAAAYHTAYQAIKKGDPDARIAIGAVSQVTPLRLAYLDRILAAYRQAFGERLPVDMWNIHTFVLREEKESWGVGIPPGMENVTQGVLWDIEDHDRVDLVKRQVLDMRRWLYNRGYENLPLTVSEYGILMPAEYGFPPERVITFLRQSFDLFLTLRDPFLGYRNDDNRLVQQWCWYSMADTRYPTGNLFDPVRKTLTTIGAAFATYRGPSSPQAPPSTPNSVP